MMHDAGAAKLKNKADPFSAMTGATGRGGGLHLPGDDF
jgi:hypothetical protein